MIDVTPNRGSSWPSVRNWFTAAPIRPAALAEARRPVGAARGGKVHHVAIEADDRIGCRGRGRVPAPPRRRRLAAGRCTGAAARECVAAEVGGGEAKENQTCCGASDAGAPPRGSARPRRSRSRTRRALPPDQGSSCRVRLRAIDHTALGPQPASRPHPGRTARHRSRSGRRRFARPAAQRLRMAASWPPGERRPARSPSWLAADPSG